MIFSMAFAFLFKVIYTICIRYKVAMAQIVPTSFHNICLFITTCELLNLKCIAHTFA